MKIRNPFSPRNLSLTLSVMKGKERISGKQKNLDCGKEEGLMDSELICRQPDKNGVMCQKKATVQIILQGPGMIDSAEATNPLRLYVHICDEHALQLIKGYHEDIVGIKAIV